MSDLYLELRTRIPLVTSWVQVGTDRLQDAQDATGLSNERLARQIPVSVKTWERWKKRGEVPADSIPAVARVLGIEIRRADGRPIEASLSRDGEIREIRDLLVSRLPPVIEFRTALRAAQLLAGYDDERLAQRLERAAGELGVDRADADWRGVIHAFRSGDLTPSPESRLVVDRALPRLRDLEANPTLLLRELVDALAAASDAGTSNGS